MPKVGKSLLLDSSIIIAGFKQNKEVLAALNLADSLYVPVIAYGDETAFDPEPLELLFTATLQDGDLDLATDQFAINLA